MGTTPVFGFPYPDPSDLVANYPALGQQLAEDVEDAIYARKILQIVRDTDVTPRTTTSTSFVDVTGMSVTITPQFSTSAILIVAGFLAQSLAAGITFQAQITDASNNVISGAERIQLNTGAGAASLMAFAYATPATTSATTYKLRFRTVTAGTVDISNDIQTGQMLAIEVSA